MPNPIIGANSRFDIDTVTVNSEDSSYPKERLYDDRLFTLYKSAATAANPTYIQTFSASNVTVDYLMIAGHDLFTQGKTVTFEYSDNGAAWSTVASISFAPSDDRIIARSFTGISHKYYRLAVSGNTNQFAIGQMQWGQALQFPYSLQRNFDPLKERLNARSTSSQSGNIMGTVSTFAERTARLKFTLLSNAFVRGTTVGNFQEFWDNHASPMKPFLFHWNPGNPGSFEKDAFFAIIKPKRGVSRPLATQVQTGYHNVSFDVRGLKE